MAVAAAKVNFIAAGDVLGKVLCLCVLSDCKDRTVDRATRAAKRWMKDRTKKVAVLNDQQELRKTTGITQAKGTSLCRKTKEENVLRRIERDNETRRKRTAEKKRQTSDV